MLTMHPQKWHETVSSTFTHLGRQICSLSVILGNFSGCLPFVYFHFKWSSSSSMVETRWGSFSQEQKSQSERDHIIAVLHAQHQHCFARKFPHASCPTNVAPRLGLIPDPISLFHQRLDSNGKNVCETLRYCTIFELLNLLLQATFLQVVQIKGYYVT